MFNKKGNIVVRISRHPLGDERLAYLQGKFGDDVKIITDDIRYGDDPVGAVLELLERCAQEGKVVALEAQAPFPVTIKLVGSRDIQVPIIRSQFERDESGRAVVIGQDDRDRDILAFSHYEVMKRIVFETERF